MDEADDSVIVIRREKPPHPTTLVLRQLDPAVWAQQILDCVSSIKTIVLEWDHGYASDFRANYFVAVAEEQEGVQRLRVLDIEEGWRLSEKIERSWLAGLPQHDFRLYW